MTVLRESPWYTEILKEGLEQGVKQGIEQGIERGKEQMLIRLLRHRFGALEADFVARIQAISAGQLEEVFVVALDIESLNGLVKFLDDLPLRPTH